MHEKGPFRKNLKYGEKPQTVGVDHVRPKSVDHTVKVPKIYLPTAFYRHNRGQPPDPYGVFPDYPLWKTAPRLRVFLRVRQAIACQYPDVVPQFRLLVRQDIFLVAQSGDIELIDVDNAHVFSQ